MDEYLIIQSFDQFYNYILLFYLLFAFFLVHNTGQSAPTFYHGLKSVYFDVYKLVMPTVNFNSDLVNSIKTRKFIYFRP